MVTSRKRAGDMGEKGEGNVVSNIMLSLPCDRQLLELVGDHIRHKNVESTILHT